jgi:hypothetical protein
MSTIVTRAGKGSPLTHTEVDNNFTNLNTDKYQSGDNVSVGTLSATGVATFSAGTVSAPAITTSGDTNTGIFFPAADTIAFAEGGAEAMRITSAGNLCVGSADAGNAGAINVSVGLAGTTVGGLQLWSTTNSTHYVNFGDGTSGTDTYRGYVGYAHGSDSLLFGTSTSERMRIDSSGNVQIAGGSTNTTYTSGGQLAIKRSNSNPYLSFHADNGTSQAYIQSNTASAFEIYSVINQPMAFGTNNTERMRITSGGLVGIGSTSPVTDRALTLNSTSNYFGIALQTSGTTRGQLIQESTGNIYLDAGSDGGSGALILRTTGNERMRITSGGDVYVGTTSALSNIAKIQINGGAGSTITSQTTGTGATDHVNFRNDNGKIGTITTNGSATAYNTSSDYRLKENIAPMTGALNKITQLKPCTYTWKSDGSAGEGFIAHELQAVVPDAVVGEKDAVDEEGKPIYQGVDTSFLVATLTAAIQELNAKVEAQAAEIALLKSK